MSQLEPNKFYMIQKGYWGMLPEDVGKPLLVVSVTPDIMGQGFRVKVKPAAGITYESSIPSLGYLVSSQTFGDEPVEWVPVTLPPPLPSDPVVMPEEITAQLGFSPASEIFLPKDPVPSCQPLELQVGGDHYKKCKIQPAEYSHANGLGFIEGSVVKYITRHRDKNGKEDLEKIKHLVDILIEMEYGNE